MHVATPFYHVTLVSNLGAIIKDGLRPRSCHEGQVRWPAAPVSLDHVYLESSAEHASGRRSIVDGKLGHAQRQQISLRVDPSAVATDLLEIDHEALGYLIVNGPGQFARTEDDAQHLWGLLWQDEQIQLAVQSCSKLTPAGSAQLVSDVGMNCLHLKAARDLQTELRDLARANGRALMHRGPIAPHHLSLTSGWQDTIAEDYPALEHLSRAQRNGDAPLAQVPAANSR